MYAGKGVDDRGGVHDQARGIATWGSTELIVVLVSTCQCSTARRSLNFLTACRGVSCSPGEKGR